jgi:hypothetical protein
LNERAIRKKELGMPKKEFIKKIAITFGGICELIKMALDGTTLV